MTAHNDYYIIEDPEPDIEKLIHCFRGYMEQEGNKPPTGREFELNLTEKMKDSEFTGDIEGLLRPEIGYDQNEAFEAVYNDLIRNV